MNSETVIDRCVVPEDLITEILVYLPVKSLLRFKCVSKQWLWLITSPEFIKSHLSTSSSREIDHHQVLFTAGAGDFMKRCCLSSALYDPCSTHVSDILKYPYMDTYFQIVGIVNGLVCLSVIGANKFCLWNPVLRKSMYLHNTKYTDKQPRDSVCVVHGFGYDQSNDDYKIFKLSRVYHGPGKLDTTMVEIYSVQADKWKRIDDLKGEVLCHNGSYANGKILWIASRQKSVCKIVSFDMTSNKYEEIKGPVNEARVMYSGITVLDGRRIYVRCCHLRVKTDVWVMDKFGAEGSWSKVFSIPYDDGTGSVPQVIKPTYIIGKALCITRKGQIILQDNSPDGALLVYSCKDKEFRRIQLGNLKLFDHVFVYAESLVSPIDL